MRGGVLVCTVQIYLLGGENRAAQYVVEFLRGQVGLSQHEHTNLLDPFRTTVSQSRGRRKSSVFIILKFVEGEIWDGGNFVKCKWEERVMWISTGRR